ncbi:MAG: hypothetical protein WCO98_01060 [bacterium]
MEQVQQDKKSIFPVITQYIAQVAAIAIAIKALTFAPAASIMVILPLLPVSLLTLVLFFIPLSKKSILPGIGGGIILALFSYASIGQFITTSDTFVQPATDFIPKIAPLLILTGIIVLVLTLIANRGENKYSSFGNSAVIGAIFISILTTFFYFAFTQWLPVKYLIEPGNLIKMISFAFMVGFSIYIGDHAMPRNKNYPIWPIVSVILVVLYTMKMIGVKG